MAKVTEDGKAERSTLSSELEALTARHTALDTEKQELVSAVTQLRTELAATKASQTSSGTSPLFFISPGFHSHLPAL